MSAPIGAVLDGLKGAVRRAWDVDVATLPEDATLSGSTAFAPEVVREGFHSVDAARLRLRREVIGALNLLGTQPAPPAD